MHDGKALPVGAYTFNGWTRDDLIFLLVVSGNVDYVRIYSPKLGKYVSKLSSIGIVAGVNLTEAMRNSDITVPGSPPSTRTKARSPPVEINLTARLHWVNHRVRPPAIDTTLLDGVAVQFSDSGDFQ